MSRLRWISWVVLLVGAACSQEDRGRPVGPLDGGSTVQPGQDGGAAARDAASDALRPSGGAFVDASYTFPGDRAPGTGGAGGASGAGGSRADASAAFDGLPGAGGSGGAGGAGGRPGADGGGFRDAAAFPDAGGFPDAGAADGSPPAPPVDAPGPRPCAVELRAISASSLARLVAGPTATALVRAELLNVSDPGNLRWTWQITYLPTNMPLVVTPDPGDPTIVQFRVERGGQYSITAATSVGGAVCSSGVVTASAEEPGPQRRLFLVRAIPPLSARLPVQHRVLQVVGGVPVVAELRLDVGSDITVDPRDQGTQNTIVSYVRVADLSTPLLLEGYADQQAGFGAFLAPGEYQVMVIPTGADGQGVAAARHAPFVLERATPESIKAFSFSLTSGVPVRGRITDGRGVVVDARVILRGSSVPSTVGRTGSDGAYEVLARTGVFGVAISPPQGSGLPEAHLGAADGAGQPTVTLVEGTPAPAIDFAWDPVDAAELTLRVVDGQDRPAPQARVRVQAQLARAGFLTVTPPAPGERRRLSAAGTMRLDGETDGTGVARFGRVPRAAYSVLVAPSASAAGAITSAAITLDAPGVVHTVRLGRMARIIGSLSGRGELGGVRITATDVGMDLSTSPVIGETAADGSFALPVSPRRRYLVLAQPPASGAFARTFVGGGPLEGSELPIRQVLPARIAFSGRVVSDMQRNGIPDTVIKVFCYPGAADCPDPTVPLGEAVTAADGSFDMPLPDPSSR